MGKRSKMMQFLSNSFSNNLTSLLLLKFSACFVFLSISFSSFAVQDEFEDARDQQIFQDLAINICRWSVVAEEPKEYLVNAVVSAIENVDAPLKLTKEMQLQGLNKHRDQMRCFGKPFTFYAIDSGTYPLVIEYFLMSYLKTDDTHFDFNAAGPFPNPSGEMVMMTLLDYIDVTVLNAKHPLSDPKNIETFKKLKTRLMKEFGALHFNELPMDERNAIRQKYSEQTRLNDQPNSYKLLGLLLGYQSPHEVYSGLHFLLKENALMKQQLLDKKAYDPDLFHFSLMVENAFGDIPYAYTERPTCSEFLSSMLLGEGVDTLEALDPMHQFFYTLYQKTCDKAN